VGAQGFYERQYNFLNYLAPGTMPALGDEWWRRAGDRPHSARFPIVSGAKGGGLSLADLTGSAAPFDAAFLDIPAVNRVLAEQLCLPEAWQENTMKWWQERVPFAETPRPRLEAEPNSQ
jgi:hypothetical protein